MYVNNCMQFVMNDGHFSKNDIFATFYIGSTCSNLQFK